MRPDKTAAIEAQLAQDRIALAQSLRALQDRLSFDALWADGVSMAKAKVAPMGAAIGSAVFANPLAVALTTSGLGWLHFGHPESQNRKTTPPLDPVSRWEDEGGQIAPLSASDFDWIEEADRLCARASDMLLQIDAAARAGSVPAQVLAESRADIMAALTQDVRRVMAQGLDDLEQNARVNALVRREHTYHRHHQTRADRPWNSNTVANAAVTAIGGVIKAFLPQSRRDNDVHKSDRFSS